MPYQKGQKFNCLTAIEPTGLVGPWGSVWRFRCVCGRIIEAPAYHVKRGFRKSCGCQNRALRVEQARQMRPKQHIVDGTRVDTISKNAIPRHNTSGVVGVSWNQQRKKWRAAIVFRKKQIHLGFYDDFSDAVAARRRGEEQYFHPFLESIGMRPEGGTEHDTQGHVEGDHTEQP